MAVVWDQCGCRDRTGDISFETLGREACRQKTETLTGIILWIIGRPSIVQKTVFSLVLLGGLPIRNVTAGTQVSVPAEACVYFAGQVQTDLQASFPPDANWESEPWDVASLGIHADFHLDTAPWEGIVRAEINAGDAEGFSLEDRTAASTIPPCSAVNGLDTLTITADGSWARGPLDPHVGPEGWVGAHLHLTANTTTSESVCCKAACRTGLLVCSSVIRPRIQGRFPRS